MLAEIARVVTHVTFWAHVLGACVGWYLLARIFSSVAFSSGGQAYPAAKKGGNGAIVPAMLLVGLVEWLWLKDPAWAVMTVTMTFVLTLVLMIVLNSMEPARAE